MMRRPTLGDGAPEQPRGTGHGQQRADAHRPSRLATDGDVARIATKGGDMLPYPREGGDLVEHAEVGDAVAEREETLGTNPVIDGHADDAIAGKTATIIPGRRTRAVILKHAARNPDQHRLPRRPKVGGPDIEVQAILPGDGTLREEHVHRRGKR